MIGINKYLLLLNGWKGDYGRSKVCMGLLLVCFWDVFILLWLRLDGCWIKVYWWVEIWIGRNYFIGEKYDDYIGSWFI